MQPVPRAANPHWSCTGLIKSQPLALPLLGQPKLTWSALKQIDVLSPEQPGIQGACARPEHRQSGRDGGQDDG